MWKDSQVIGNNEWDDTALQTQDSTFEPLRPEAEHATSRSWTLPTILNLHLWAEKKHLLDLQCRPPTEQGVGKYKPKLVALLIRDLFVC